MEKKICLSIEQMRELKELGVETKDASMCWVRDPEGHYYPTVHDESCYEMSFMDPAPAFTLQDMLEKMPKELKGYDLVLFADNHIQYEKWNGHSPAKILCEFNGESLLETTFNMLVWLAKERDEQ